MSWTDGLLAALQEQDLLGHLGGVPGGVDASTCGLATLSALHQQSLERALHLICKPSEPHLCARKSKSVMHHRYNTEQKKKVAVKTPNGFAGSV